MRIGELATAAGTTTRALRHYEHEGLLTSGRNPNGYRVYGEHAVVRVRNIRELLATGFTIADVRAFLAYLDRDLPPRFGAGDGNTCATAMAVARQRLADLRHRIDTLTALHDRLADRL
ncbi:MerR family transcriptional regulator [Virgisporangium aurantiacum]|uniref:MerR family transcriptional regulator n=1 Tax=Virgisporangium aurantiacum TaxID=175570 RepID=A0A8J4DZW9_9ACTN|nr:MerR family transcriptional regulator [Virgisporangium aurantiacum]GIJ56394.1 MerR family transcriptional regulator [Virgisporangium aurantiacum]